MLHIRRPHDDRNRQSKAQPELVAEHCHGMSGVAVVAAWHRVTGVRAWGRYMLMSCHRFHFHTAARLLSCGGGDADCPCKYWMRPGQIPAMKIVWSLVLRLGIPQRVSQRAISRKLSIALG